MELRTGRWEGEFGDEKGKKLRVPIAEGTIL